MQHKINDLKLLTDENILPEVIIYLRPGHFDSQVSIKSLEILISKNLIINFPFIITVENNLKKVKIRIRELKI